MLLIKSLAVMSFMIIMFLMKSVPSFHGLSYAWVAFFGTMLLFILSDESRAFPKYLHEVEWATLLFFAALFVLMECLAELGLIQYLGDRLKDAINESPPQYRMLITVVSIVWVSDQQSKRQIRFETN